MNPQELPRHLEYTLFAPDATRADIENLCAEARRHSFHNVCVNGDHVELAYSLLEDSGVQVAALVGFPLGAGDADAKRYETEIAIDQGAHEIDFVLNHGRLKDGNRQHLLREMRDIAEAADERPVKVIVESHLLDREQKILACQLALDSGVKFISTATDFHSPAVSLDDLKLYRATLGKEFGLKAVGAIRDTQTALAAIAAGANRIGIQTLLTGA